MRLRRFFLPLLLCFLGHAFDLAAQVLPETHPLSSLHHGFFPKADFLDARETETSGEFETQFSLNWGSTAIREDEFTVDAEVLRFDPELRFTVSDELMAYARFPLILRGGGVLDDPIEGWHSIFSLPNGDRNRLPEDDYSVSATTENGDEFRLPQDGFGVGNIVLGAAWEFSGSLLLQFDASLPRVSDNFGHEGFDFSLGLLSRTQFGKLDLDLGAAVLWLENPDFEELQFRDWRPEGYLGLSYEFWQGVRLFTRLRVLGETIINVRDYPSALIYQDFGVRAAIRGGLLLELSLRENPLGGDGTSDVEFGVSLRL